MQAVVLASGGLDSSLILSLLKDRSFDLYPLHIHYGQRAAQREWDALKRVCHALDVRPPIQLNLDGISQIPSALTNPRLDLATQAFLPMRNLLFLVAGGSFAASRGIHSVAIGLVANPIFPDQTESFVNAAEAAMTEAIGRKISVMAPLIKLDKRSVLALARSKELPIDDTYYCHSGEATACGRCLACAERLAAEQAIGGAGIQ